jgi:hypothetical protein
MGNSLKDELARIDIMTMTTNAVIDRLVPKPSDPYENMTPEEREEHERAMARSELDAAFERLGLHDKLEAIKPDLEICKGLLRNGPTHGSASVKRLIEFIECLDEPQ